MCEDLLCCVELTVYNVKKLSGKTKPCDLNNSEKMELNQQVYSPSSSECSNTSPWSLRMRSTELRNSMSLNLWSPLSNASGSSSEENDAVADEKSCKQIKDKPPLLKNLVEVVRESVLGKDGFNKDTARLSCGGFINENSWESTSCVPKFSVNNKKFPLVSRNEAISAIQTDEESLLESETSSQRSSCDHSLPSDSTILNNSLDVSGCNRNKRNSHTGSASSNSSITPPPPPERYDSLSLAITEERELRGAPWFQAGIPREIALEILAQKPIGAFMVRESTSKPGCFALSLRVPRDFHQSGIAHYLIMRMNRGYKIKGFTKEFTTLSALITHHSVMPELLPCPLLLSRRNSFRKHEDMVDVNDDPHYNWLSHFRKVLPDINV